MAQWSRIGLQSKGCRRCKLDPWVRKISLEKEMATDSSILAWRNPMDRGARWATVRGVTKSWTRLSTAQGSQLPSTQLLFSWFSEWGSCCPESCALSGHCPSQPGLPSRSSYQHTGCCLILKEAAGVLKQRHLISFHSTEPWEHRVSSLGIPFLTLKPTDTGEMNGDTLDPNVLFVGPPTVRYRAGHGRE